MNSKCHFCGNKNFKNTQVQHIYQLNNQFLIMDGVPYEQYEFCGKSYFEGKVLMLKIF
ncbi:MAG: YgiT-type zinc finger protein [Thioploca sp.]|nr:YgiT-type zinc finger protein [Thioploca sp.]